MSGKKTITNKVSKHTRYQSGNKAGQLKTSMHSGGSYPSIYKHNASLSIRGKKKSVMQDFVITEDIAYNNSQGLYLHSWVVNFERALKTLAFQAKIESKLQPHVDYYNSQLDRMIQALQVNAEEQAIIERITTPSSVLGLFQSLKSKKKKINSIIRQGVKPTSNKPKKSKRVATGNSKLNNDLKKIANSSNEEVVLQALQQEVIKVTKTALSSLSNSQYSATFLSALENEVEEWATTLDLKQILLGGEIGNTLANEKTKINGLDSLMNGITNFYILSKAFEIAAKECNKLTITTDPNSINKNYSNAANIFKFLDMLNNLNFDEFLNVQPTVFVKRYGYFFEPLMAVLYGGQVVGHLDNKITATDVLLNYDMSLNNLEKSLTTSLKTGALIYRQQDIEGFFIHGQNSQYAEDRIAQDMKPIKYFYLNFALLMEYQTILKTTRSNKVLQDIHITSSEEIMGVYNYLANALGKYYFTNMIVGYFLKNGTKNEDLKTLPKIIFNSKNQQMYPTKDVLSKIRNDVVKSSNRYNMAFVHANISGKMVEDYVQFCLNKSKRKGYLEDHGEPVSYRSLIADNTGGKAMQYYRELSKDAESFKLVTAVDLAVMMEKTHML